VPTFGDIEIAVAERLAPHGQGAQPSTLPRFSGG
jgi:hypothetical protein